VTRAAGSVVSCWGDNTLGQLGNGTVQNVSNVPTNVMFTGIASNLAAGSHHTCAIITTDQTSGGLFCWGANGNGQFGDGDEVGSTVPKASATGLQERILSVEAGGDYTCVLVAGTRAAAFCWGLGDLGQLGDGMSTSTDTPVAIGKPQTFRSLSTGPAHACAGISGGVQCWGQNPLGEIGDGTTTDRPSPTGVLF
jgi:alpha-tubulin suppressor-like RCC1 family protein